MNKSIRFTILLAVVFGGTSAFIQTAQLPKSIERGKEAYITYCMSCHMADGVGMPGMYPPLAKSDFLKKPTKEQIDVILKGQSGEIKVNGVNYNSIMPAQNYLTDQQIADILNYVRNTWGNKNTVAISAATVAKNR